MPKSQNIKIHVTEVPKLCNLRIKMLNEKKPMKLPNSNFCWQKKGYRDNRKTVFMKEFTGFSVI